jgi:hypothetical protein
MKKNNAQEKSWKCLFGRKKSPNFFVYQNFEKNKTLFREWAKLS